MKKIFSANLTIDFITDVEFDKAPKELELFVGDKIVFLNIQNLLLINSQQIYIKLDLNSKDVLLSSLDDYIKLIKTSIEKLMKAEVDDFSKMEELYCLTSDEESSMAYSVDLIEDILALRILLNEMSIIETKIGPSLKSIAETRDDFRQDHFNSIKTNLNEMKPKLEKVLEFIKKIS